MSRPDPVTQFRSPMHWPRVLFVLKHRESPWGDYGCGPDRSHPGRYAATGQTMSSGLRNSVHFVAGMLRTIGVTADIVVVRDNNDIDREVAMQPQHQFRIVQGANLFRDPPRNRIVVTEKTSHPVAYPGTQ